MKLTVAIHRHPRDNTYSYVSFGEKTREEMIAEHNIPWNPDEIYLLTPAVTREDAELIARAVNSHDALVTQLEAQTNWFIAAMLPTMSPQEQKIWWDEIGTPAKAVIAKAKEPSP